MSRRFGEPIEEKKKEKSPAKKMRDKLDRLCGKVVRSAQECFACGEVMERGNVYRCSTRYECCHILSRGNLKIRHHPLNMVCMCNIHHRYYTTRTKDWDDLIDKKLPGRKDELYELRRTCKTTPEEWETYWKNEPS